MSLSRSQVAEHVWCVTQDYVVSSLVVRYQLVQGKYERDHNQLEVQQIGRYFLNRHLDELLSS